MNSNTTNYATKLAILQATLAFLYDGEGQNDDYWRGSNFVCHALRYATAKVVKVTARGDDMCYAEAMFDADYIELQAKVIERIGGFDCVERYLEDIAIVNNDVVFVQNYRRTIVLGLIAEYEAKLVKAEV